VAQKVGREGVEEKVWKRRCGREGVEEKVWKRRCGREGVAQTFLSVAFVSKKPAAGSLPP
jgi:hypothetical protein